MREFLINLFIFIFYIKNQTFRFYLLLLFILYNCIYIDVNLIMAQTISVKIVVTVYSVTNVSFF